MSLDHPTYKRHKQASNADLQKFALKFEMFIPPHVPHATHCWEMRSSKKFQTSLKEWWVAYLNKVEDVIVGSTYFDKTMINLALKF